MFRSAFIVMLLFWVMTEAYSIPAFARKYKTSCATCHVAYPKLNAVGESFRLNGYQFTEDDAEKAEEEPVSLGSDAYKRVWPEAIWPNEIPGVPPISLRGRFGLNVKRNAAGTSSSFGLPTLQIISGGTVGEDITLFVGAHLFEEGEAGSIDRFFLKLDNLLSSYLPRYALHLRFGQFIPDIVPFASVHRGLTITPFAFNTYGPSLGSSFQAGHVHGGGPFGIENFQLGAEASGVFASRARYVVGFVNGTGPALDNNAAKDFYGRLSYKVGGIGFDGSQPEDMEASATSGMETALTIGGFAYKGKGQLNSVNASFYRAGFDAGLTYGGAELLAGVIVGEDMDKRSYNLIFAQADYFMYPWLVGLVRYELARPEGLTSASQVIGHVSAYYVANIKFVAETSVDLNNIDFTNLTIGLDFAF